MPRLSLVIMEGNAVDGRCIFDGDAVSLGLALFVTSALEFEAATDLDSPAT